MVADASGAIDVVVLGLSETILSAVLITMPCGSLEPGLLCEREARQPNPGALPKATFDPHRQKTVRKKQSAPAFFVHTAKGRARKSKGGTEVRPSPAILARAEFFGTA